MTDRKHYHNGLYCGLAFKICPGGCVNHLQDEQHTPDCESSKLALQEARDIMAAAWSPERASKIENFYMNLQQPININLTPVGLTAFELTRRNDESGVSGTGLVLQGMVFNDGSVAVRWCTENAGHSSTVYGPEDGTSGWQKFLSIHVLSHPTNGTVIVFYPATSSLSQYQWEQPNVPAAPERPPTVDESLEVLRRFIERERKQHMGNKIVFPRIDFKRRVD